MKTTIKVVKVYSEILDEYYNSILVISENGKRFLGLLLDKEEEKGGWFDEEVKETLYSVDFTGTIKETVNKIVEVYKINGLKVYDSSAKSISWWGYLNGLFTEYVEMN